MINDIWIFLNSRFGVPITVLLLLGIYFAIPESYRYHFTIPLVIAYLTWMVYLIKIDRDQHRKALSDSRLDWLSNIGMAIEHRGRYAGYKGGHRGYFLRVYVDPNPLPGGLRGEVNICAILHYKPRQQPDGKRDIAELRRVQTEIENEYSWWTSRRINTRDRDLVLTYRMTQFTKQRIIQREMDKLIDKAIKHRLQPSQEEEVEQWIEKAPHLYGPEIREFQENFKERK